MHRHAPAASPPARSLVPRVLAAGALVMLLIGAVGAGFIVWRLGGDAAATTARIEAEVRARFRAYSAALAGVVEQLKARPEVVAALDPATRDQRVLFDAVDDAASRSARDVAITIAEPDGTAVAWAGRAQAVPAGRDG